MDSQPFWKVKKLNELTRLEWEALCDGCAQCCLIKLQDEDSHEIYTTRVVCRLLDQQTCRCTDYAQRRHIVRTCLVLTPSKVHRLRWIPATCAYRLVAEGKELYPWHPLISGSRESVHTAGISVRGRTISEQDIDPDDLEDYIEEDRID